MSNYRRLISYIYAYEGGIKGKNIGYAKIEVRSGQCRIYVSVKRIYIGSNDIGVYLLTPGSELLLGRIFIRNGSGEFRISIPAENIDGSGCSMDQCYGLTIHDVENTWQCYTTIWEDAVAHVAEVELADVTAENARKRQMEQENNSLLEAAEPASEAELQLPISAEIERELKQEEESLKDVDPWQAEAEEEMLPEGMETTGAEKEAPPEEALPEEMETTEIAEITEAAEIAETKTIEAPESAAAVQENLKSDSISDEASGTELPQKSILKVLQEAIVKMPRSASKPAVREPEQPAQRTASPEKVPQMAPEPENLLILEELDRLEQQESMQNDIWSRMQRRYAKVLAFDYDNGCEILSIKPQDIGLLPREIWVYGNNSFLLHGYYNYRHLILAKLNNPNGNPRYLLGVPGHYFSNEKYMASMFGFPHFVLARKQPQQDGRFGYWYTDIRL